MSVKKRHEIITPTEIDKVVDNHIKEVIEALENYVAPTIDSYRKFLEREKDWLAREITFRTAKSDDVHFER